MTNIARTQIGPVAVKPRTNIDWAKRCNAAMQSAGWLRGIIRARQQFADDDRRSALKSAALGLEHEALALHQQADTHLAAMDEACKQLARMK